MVVQVRDHSRNKFDVGRIGCFLSSDAALINVSTLVVSKVLVWLLMLGPAQTEVSWGRL